MPTRAVSSPVRCTHSCSSVYYSSAGISLTALLGDVCSFDWLSVLAWFRLPQGGYIDAIGLLYHHRAADALHTVHRAAGDVHRRGQRRRITNRQNRIRRGHGRGVPPKTPPGPPHPRGGPAPPPHPPPPH